MTEASGKSRSRNVFSDSRILYHLRGYVWPRAMLFAVPSAALAVGLHALFEATGISPGPLSNAGSVWTVLTAALGALIVFRTNQAYQRYWEGATLLLQVRGEWLNASSSLIAFCTSKPELQVKVATFQHQLVRLMSLLYCSALQQVTLIADEALEVIDMTGLDDESLVFLVETEERCDVLLQWIRKLIVQQMSDGVIPVPPPILTRVFQELSRGLVGAKDVQKIADFPFPRPYAQLIGVLLVAQTALTPLMAIVMSGDPAWSVAVTFVSVLALWSINFIATELEQPFGEDANDLPIADMMREMNIRLIALLDERVKTPPTFNGRLSMIDLQVVDCVQSCLLNSRKRLSEVRPSYPSDSSLMAAVGSESSLGVRHAANTPSWQRKISVASSGSNLGPHNSHSSDRKVPRRPIVSLRHEAPAVVAEGVPPMSGHLSPLSEHSEQPALHFGPKEPPPPFDHQPPCGPSLRCESTASPAANTDTTDCDPYCGPGCGPEDGRHGQEPAAAIDMDFELPRESQEVACVPRGHIGRTSLGHGLRPAQGCVGLK